MAIVHRTVRHREHPQPVGLRTRARAGAAPCRRHEPPADQADDPGRVGHHRRAGRGPGGRGRHPVRRAPCSGRCRTAASRTSRSPSDSSSSTSWWRRSPASRGDRPARRAAKLNVLQAISYEYRSLAPARGRPGPGRYHGRHMPTLTLPDGSTTELPEGEPVGGVLDRGAIAARVDGELRDLSFVPEADAAVEPVDAGLAGRPARPAPLERPTSWRRRCASCSRARTYAIGPAIEDGFYYDFELPEPLYAGATSTDRTADAEDREADQPFVREELTRAEALRALRRPAVQAARSSRSLEPGEGAGGDTVSAVPQRRLGRPVPGAARAVDRQAGRLQADPPRRRVLARRRAAPAAHARLRHGVGHPGGSRRAPASAGGGGAPRPPPAGRRARPVLVPRRDRLGPRGVPPARRPRAQADGGLLAASATRRPATSS